MEEWQTRVTKEQEELNVKLLALTAFISGDPRFEALAEEDKYLLRQQRDAMIEYSYMLEARIMRFTTAE